MILGIGTALIALSKTIADEQQTPLIITPRYEQRERFERRDNKVFSNSKNDSRSDLYSRVRPGFTYTYGEKVSGEFTYQYAHDLYTTVNGNASTENSDLLVGYVKYKSDEGAWSIGRERLKKGNERLIGESGWNNISNSFDVARFEGKGLDLFAGRLSVAQSMSEHQRIAGGSYDWSQGETMLVVTHDDPKGTNYNDQYTLDHLYKQNLGTLHFEAEGAYQLGNVNSTLTRAWAVSGRATENLTQRWSVSVEGNAASGGTTKDGTSTTFNNLYPTNHYFYGNADMQGWINMGELDVETAYKPLEKLKLTAEYHHFWLHDASDAWYGNSGTANKIGSTTYISPTGAFGKDIGQELSLDAVFDMTKKIQICAGVADFMPGRFVESFVTTGSTIRQIWAYAQVNVKF